MMEPMVEGFPSQEIEALARFVADLDPDTVPTDDAPGLWLAGDHVERLGAAVKVLLARRVDDSKHWKETGDASAAHWIARQSGTTITAGKRIVTTSNRLSELDRTGTALRAGQLSTQQTELIADAAAQDPESESGLLEAARCQSLAELRETCGRVKAAADPDPEARYRRIHRNRRLRQGTTADGAWTLHMRGPVDAGAGLNAVLGPVIDEMFRAARTEGRREPREAYAFDALCELVNRANHPTESSSKRPNPKYLALLRVDFQALVRGQVDGEELCEITGLGPVPVSVARGLLGDAILKLVITKGVDVAHVTHLGRGPTVAQQIALRWRSPMCVVQGCYRTDIEHDHGPDWAHTHRTRVDELENKCGHHHRLKTRYGWALIDGTGKRPMVPPSDPRHPKHKPEPVEQRPGNDRSLNHPAATRTPERAGPHAL
jgi:hypothetical protein